MPTLKSWKVSGLGWMKVHAHHFTGHTIPSKTQQASDLFFSQFYVNGTVQQPYAKFFSRHIVL